MLWGISLPMLLLCFCGCSSIAPPTVNACQDYTLDYDTPVNPTLQAKLEKIDTDLRARFGEESWKLLQDSVGSLG